MKDEKTLYGWFTINVVDEIVPSLNRKVINDNGPIRTEEECKRMLCVKECVLTVHTPTQSSGICNHSKKLPISVKMSEDIDLSKSKKKSRIRAG